jgi:hypothetical protein
MSLDDDSQQQSAPVADDTVTPAPQVSADPDAPLFDTPELDISLREAERGHEHRDKRD